MLRRELFFVSTNFISNFFSKNLKELPFIFSQIFFRAQLFFLLIKFKIPKK